MSKMKLELIKIDVIEADEGSAWGPSGKVFIKVNGRDYIVAVHGCGEIDVESDDLTEEEEQAAFEFYRNNKKVGEAFDGEQYDK